MNAYTEEEDRKQENGLNRIPFFNPLYDTGDRGAEINCARCAAALPLYLRGYDVEATLRPSKQDWKGFGSIYDVDWANTDNYIAAGSIYAEDYIGSKYGDVPMISKKTQTIPTRFTKTATPIKPDIMPRGPEAAAKKIEDKVKSWGHGAVGAMNVDWKDRDSGHVVNILNRNGVVFIYDAQSGKHTTDLLSYLKRTRAVRTSIVRLDNAPIRQDLPNLDSVVKRKEKK